MRALDTKEKQIIDFLLKVRNQHEYSKLQFAYILRQYVDYDFVEWDISEKQEYFEVFKKGCSKKQLSELFFQIVDFLSFIQELERKGYLFTTQLKHQHHEYPRSHFDRNKIEKLPIGYFVKSQDCSYILKEEGDITYRVYGEITSQLEKYLDCVIIPVQPLIDFAENGYRSLEDRRTNKALLAAYISTLVALLIGFKSELAGFLKNLYDFIVKLIAC